MTAIFNFFGDVAGRFVGVIISFGLGLALYIPAVLLVAVINIYRQLYNSLFILDQIMLKTIMSMNLLLQRYYNNSLIRKFIHLHFVDK